MTHTHTKVNTPPESKTQMPERTRTHTHTHRDRGLNVPASRTGALSLNSGDKDTAGLAAGWADLDRVLALAFHSAPPNPITVSTEHSKTEPDRPTHWAGDGARLHSSRLVWW